jgi:hypothetical protein
MNTKRARDRRATRLEELRAIDEALHRRPPKENPPSVLTLHPPDTLPNPWLFDSEKLLRELDRIREMVLRIPATTQEVHFASNNAISAIWNLTEDLRYLLSLHRGMQRSWAKKTIAADEDLGTRQAAD